ncbi:MAG TPA: DUF305 domain-containing protein [Gemmatimonadaceae bacterium]|nr:DUF305 domain-containing protein [Gemmatimonadaceae bacterium]
MKYSEGHLVAATLAAISLACGGAARQPMDTSAEPERGVYSDSAAVARARADSARIPYTEADVRFMSGMIGHHAQAILIARWAPTHDASRQLQVLAERVINAQQDEIALMQTWLRDRRQPVPEPRIEGTMVTMSGSEHAHHMPGMLTAEQLAQLNAARGKEFDRLFLTFMIQHHQGAVQMVNELVSSQGAALDNTVFKLASDISADQSSEIERMQRMLAAMTLGIPSP